MFPPSRTQPAGSSTIGADTVSMVRVRGVLLCAALLAVRASADSLSYGPSSFAPPGAFPTQLYASYYNDPTATSAQPQPVISDPVLVRAHCGIYRRSALMTSYIFFVEQGISRRAHRPEEHTSGASARHAAFLSYGFAIVERLFKIDNCLAILTTFLRFPRMILKTRTHSHLAHPTKPSCKPR